MAIQTMNRPFWLGPYPQGYAIAPSFTTTNFTLDAADEGCAVLCQAPATGNIAKIGWGTRTVTTGATMDVRVETVDATTGFPSGTLWATNTNGSQVVNNTDDNVSFLTTLTASASVNRGDYMAIVIKNPNASFGNLQIAGFADESDISYPFFALNTGVSPAVSWAKVGASINMWVEYDSGAYYEIPNIWPIKDTVNTSTISTSTTPDVVGMYFQLPFPARLSHAWIWGDWDGDFKVMLVSSAYNQAGATGILATLSVDKDYDATTQPGILKLTFPTPYDISANTFYRLIIEPTTTTAISVYDFNLDSAAALGAWGGGTDFCFTSAKDPTQDSDWTNYNSGTFRKLFAGLAFSGFDDGASGGGGDTFILCE